jgi:hypothetical protein
MSDEPFYSPNRKPAIAGDRLRFSDLRPREDCPACGGHGWRCEAHPLMPWPHDDCAGPGVPCEAPGCLADWLHEHAEARHE